MLVAQPCLKADFMDAFQCNSNIVPLQGVLDTHVNPNLIKGGLLAASEFMKKCPKNSDHDKESGTCFSRSNSLILDLGPFHGNLGNSLQSKTGWEDCVKRTTRDIEVGLILHNLRSNPKYPSVKLTPA